MSRLNIVATGDISFMGKNVDTPTIEPFSDVLPVFRNRDLVIGNLEGPLTDAEAGVQGKCVLRGSTGWAGILKKVGFNFVSLANNHIMDFGEAGLFDTIDELKNSGILYAGAGVNIEEANMPAFTDIAGLRIGLLARSAVVVTSRCYAGKGLPGVAFFDIDETVESIKNCKKKAEVVLVILHWGIEDYFYPSPKQREQAQRIFKAGADVILGHHPHVVQGIERFAKKIVAYSLGNFLFDDFDWLFQSGEGAVKTIPLRLNQDNRRGIILNMQYEDGEFKKYSRIHTITEPDGHIAPDVRSGRINRCHTLSKRLKMPFYGHFWKLHSMEREWHIRLNKKFNAGYVLKNLHKVRPHHIFNLIDNLKRSARITSGRSTNPYD